MESIPIIAGEDLLNIYNNINSFNNTYACLSFDIDASSSNNEIIHFKKGTLVKIYTDLLDESVEKDKWNGFNGAYMGQYYKVLHSISIKAYYNNTVENYIIWTYDKPVEKELDAHMSCMKGLDFINHAFTIDTQINLIGKHLDEYLDNEYAINTAKKTDIIKRTVVISGAIFGLTSISIILSLAISWVIFKMFICIIIFFIICFFYITSKSKNNEATQALIDEWNKCNNRCIEHTFDIVANLHSGEPFG